jgi:hypothetical protein
VVCADRGVAGSAAGLAGWGRQRLNHGERRGWTDVTPCISPGLRGVGGQWIADRGRAHAAGPRVGGNLSLQQLRETPTHGLGDQNTKGEGHGQMTTLQQ